MAGGRRVALIRGINVGTAKRVAMADLRALVEELGYRDVRTLLNSGNVIFSVPAAARGDPAASIEHALASRLRVRARVTVIDGAELASAIRDNPLRKIADHPSRLLLAVLARPADRKRLEPLTRQDWGPEALALGSRVAYLWCPGGIASSELAAAVNRALGDRATTRNWATVAKLLALTEGE